MSTSLLYHGFGVRGYVYERTEYREGCIRFRMRPGQSRLRCSVCRGRDLVYRGGVERELRALPIGRRPVVLCLEVARVECRSCERVRQIELGMCEPRRSYTRAFERYVVELSRRMTMLDVARHLEVSWDLVKEIQKRWLHRRFARPKLKDIRLLGIDEIAVRKGHKYLTVVCDLDRGAVVFVGEGKGAESLQAFWPRLRSSRAKIAAVAVDLAPAYTKAVQQHLPEAVVVYDRFHVIKLLNDVLTKLRRQLQHRAQTQDQYHVLKGTRWLLVKNDANLDESKDQRQRLQAALQLNAPLATAYYLKEELGQLWRQPDKANAQAFLDDWIARARAADIAPLARFADTLDKHRVGILAYHDYPITTGTLEGINNKIKTVKRQAYGFRDHEFFKLKIMSLHESRHALVG